MTLLIAVGAMLAGCDRCGDWWSPLQDQAQIEAAASSRPGRNSCILAFFEHVRPPGMGGTAMCGVDLNSRGCSARGARGSAA